ncbi:MAG: 3'(2'),5'-bisphosphate nucleotidase CysQ [Bacteroidales bacterium]|nr:3'(2'),5'-bisphosphate nucleotidase CysQ [Bacteroidales bacterium]
MENKELKALLTTATRAALEAGKKVNEVYHEKDFEVESKADESPLTLADRKAHEIITGYLNQTEYPVLSEEGKDIPYEERSKWNHFWLVDPLDGTKEFIKKNGEFTVNIALVRKDEPILGVVFAPYVNELYFGTETFGAYKVEGEKGEPMACEDIDELMKKGQILPLSEKRDKLVVVASRSHLNDETQAYVDELKKIHGDAEFVSKGSSLKICMVAEGKADVYPRFGPTMEWDTAAGHAVALAAGFPVTQKDGTPLLYNKKELLNPYFIVKSPKL